MKNVIVFGAGPLAEVVHYYLTHDSSHKVVAFSVNKEYLTDKKFLGLPVVSFETIERTYPPSKNSMFVALSYRNNNQTRADRYLEAKSKGYDLITYIHPKAMVAENVEMGDNCFIMEANVIQPYVKIGNDVIMWSGNHIGHHSRIGNHVFIASHAVISGLVTLGDYCFVGVNATIRDGVKVAEKCLLGASALIVKDTQKGGVYGGHPAKLLRVGEKTDAKQT